MIDSCLTLEDAGEPILGDLIINCSKFEYCTLNCAVIISNLLQKPCEFKLL